MPCSALRYAVLTNESSSLSTMCDLVALGEAPRLILLKPICQGSLREPFTKTTGDIVANPRLSRTCLRYRRAIQSRPRKQRVPPTPHAIPIMRDSSDRPPSTRSNISLVFIEYSGDGGACCIKLGLGDGGGGEACSISDDVDCEMRAVEPSALLTLTWSVST